MAKIHGLYVILLTALALWKYCQAEWNATDGSSNQTASACHLHGTKDNCTGDKDTGQWNGHFSKCPEELSYYCVHGECRYVQDQKTPSCKCQNNYIGARCEYVNLDWLKGGKKQILIGCIVAGLLLLIILIVSICISPRCRCILCGKRRGQRERGKNETEKDIMLSSSADLTPYRLNTSLA